MAWHSILFWLAAGLTVSFLAAVLVGRCMAFGQTPDLSPGEEGVGASDAPPADALAVFSARSR